MFLVLPPKRRVYPWLLWGSCMWGEGQFYDNWDHESDCNPRTNFPSHDGFECLWNFEKLGFYGFAIEIFSKKNSSALLQLTNLLARFGSECSWAGNIVCCKELPNPTIGTDDSQWMFHLCESSHSKRPNSSIYRWIPHWFHENKNPEILSCTLLQRHRYVHTREEGGTTGSELPKSSSSRSCSSKTWAFLFFFFFFS